MQLRFGLEPIKFIWSLYTSFSICESTLHLPELKIDTLGYYGNVDYVASQRSDWFKFESVTILWIE